MSFDDYSSLPAPIALSVGALPTPSAMLAPLLALMHDPRRDARRMANLIEADPALATSALRLVNSAAYARRGGAISAIDQAIVRLGERLLMLLITERVRSAIGVTNVAGYGMDEQGLWRHSVAVAVGARIIAGRTDAVEPGEAYTAGLLIDIGKLVLGTFVQADWERLDAAREAAGEGVSFDAIEREVLGTDHAEVGAAAARAWGLPPSIEAAIRWHHAPSQAPVRYAALAAIVHAADALAMSLGMAGGADGTGYAVDEVALSRAGVFERDVPSLLIWIDDGVREITSVLG